MNAVREGLVRAQEARKRQGYNEECTTMWPLSFVASCGTCTHTVPAHFAMDCADSTATVHGCLTTALGSSWHCTSVLQYQWQCFL